MDTTPAPITDLTPAERRYFDMVRRHGRPAPPAKRLDLQAPVADDGQSDCWTHAWEVAQRVGGTYVEGTCRRPGADGPSAHAWVEVDTPFGAQMIETTPGYENATAYRGIPVDCAPGGHIAQSTRGMRPRPSVLQMALLNPDWTYAQTLTRVAPQAAT